MTDTRYFCDMCGSRITEQRTSMKVRSGPLLRSRAQLDIGPCCLDKLTSLMTPTLPSTLEEMPTRPKQATKPITTGQVRSMPV